MLDNLTIIKADLLRKLQVKARLWGLGWLLSALTISICGFLTYRVHLINQALNDSLKLQAETTQLQVSTGQALINGWSEHKVAVERLTEWGDYVSVKQSLVRYNQGMIVSTRNQALGIK